VSDEVTYGSYLALDELLRLQRPRSRPEHSDELLFIVVHQSSELWFKTILHELDGLIVALAGREAGQALWRVQRLNVLMRIVSEQLSSLETLPPQHFAQFRSYLGSSSGAQSAQFRAIEATSGLRDAHFMEMLEEHGDIPPLVKHALDRPTLQELFLELLAADHTKVEDLYLGPGPTVLYFLAEALLEYEQLFGQWRFNHVQLVERVIGPGTGGTGGTLGARYLMRTIDQKFFPKLWEARSKLMGTREAGAGRRATGD
jgi:tryptophan 2,3-dioxygenase